MLLIAGQMIFAGFPVTITARDIDRIMSGFDDVEHDIENKKLDRIEMGGMFSVLKVRKDQKPGDYKDPGWFKHPDGTVAHEYTGPLAEPARFKAEGGQSMPRTQKPEAATEVRVRKPASHGSH